jgi:uncharacterized LabA/DUF88 family protein
MKKRVLLLVDGSNLYYKLKALGLDNLLRFDYGGFRDYLTNGAEIVDSRYYVGGIRYDGSKKSRAMLGNQQRLLRNLKQANFHYSLGYLLKSDGKYHEKGVDVQMAIDIVVAAYENICDQIVIVSSDTDLIPAIKKAKQKNIKIIYIGFSTKPSVAMVSNCDETRLLTEKEVDAFIKKRSN